MLKHFYSLKLVIAIFADLGERVPMWYMDGPISDFTHVRLRYLKRNMKMVTKIAPYQILSDYCFLTFLLLTLRFYKLVHTRYNDNQLGDLCSYTAQQFL